MSKIVTIYPGPVGHQDQFILGIYNRLVANTPTGYTILQHGSIDELCGQLSSAGQNLESAEILSHANPYYLGVILVDLVSQVATALKSAPATCNVYMTGCNTGTWIDASNTFNISANLASMVACDVYGSLGYLDGGTVAENSVNSSTNDWNTPGAEVYMGSVNASGMACYGEKPRAAMTATHFVSASNPTIPISIDSPTLSPQAKAILTNILSPLATTAPQRIAVNAQTAPDFRIAFNGQVYEFLYDNAVVRLQGSQKTWRVNLKPQQEVVLRSIYLPKAVAQAVVNAPVATQIV